MSDYSSPIAIHPGETLKDILESLNMTQVQLASRTGLHVKTINEIIKGLNPVTSDTALKLSMVFGMSESFWNNLQKNYEETLARLSLEKQLKKEQAFTLLFTCYNELARYNYIKSTRDKIEKTHYLLNFLRISSFNLLENNYQVAFRKTKKQEISKENIIAWLRCGEIEAEKINTKPFSKPKLKDSLPAIRKLNLLDASEYSSKLRELLAECGVAVAYVPYLKNTYVNGATRWLSKDKVLVQLTPRKKKEDILWFTLFHELYHIIKHSKKEGYISFWEDLFLDKDYEYLEKEADKFAAGQLIPEKLWQDFRKKNKPSNEDIKNFSRIIGVKSGIVAGRLCKETNDWARYDKLRASIQISTDSEP